MALCLLTLSTGFPRQDWPSRPPRSGWPSGETLCSILGLGVRALVIFSQFGVVGVVDPTNEEA